MRMPPLYIATPRCRSLAQAHSLLTGAAPAPQELPRLSGGAIHTQIREGDRAALLSTWAGADRHGAALEGGERGVFGVEIGVEISRGAVAQDLRR
jgi:hypothetical protein